VSIDWDVVQRKVEKGELTADEAGALIELAEDHCNAMVTLAYDSEFYCFVCDCMYRHADDCPIAILEEATSKED